MDPSENPYSAPQYESSVPPQRPSFQRPVSATVFGILHLVFGVPGLLCSPYNFYTLSVIESHDRPANAALDVMRDAPGYMTFYTGGLVAGVAMAAVLVAAGVGLLKGKRYGRSLSIVYAGLAILMVIASTVAHYYVLSEPLSQVAGPEGVAARAGGVIGAVIGPIYPILTLFFMYKRSIVEYYQ